MKFLTLFSTIACLFGCVTFTKFQLASSENPLQATPQNLASGSEIYAQHCVRCHGETGIGNGKDAPKNTPNIAGLRDKKDGVFAMYILYGKNENMPGFKEILTKEQAYQAVLFLRDLKKTE